MTPHRAIRRSAALAALLCGGAIVPITGWAHWEGFEAADPSTPAALLRFESAVSGYVEAPVTPASWLERFQADGGPAVPNRPPVAGADTVERDTGGTGESSGHAGVAQPAAAPMRGGGACTGDTRPARLRPPAVGVYGQSRLQQWTTAEHRGDPDRTAALGQCNDLGQRSHARRGGHQRRTRSASAGGR